MTQQEKSQFFSLQTRLSSLTEASLGVWMPMHESQAQFKKEARMQFSLEHSSEKIGFLHAALVDIDGFYYLLAGPSGIGKTTYGHRFQKDTGAEIVANDWVAIERESENFYVSDVNFSDSFRHTEKCLLSGVFFLHHSDDQSRDAFVPNPAEYRQLLQNTFDTATPEQLYILANFWLLNREFLPFYCAVPTRQDSKEYVGRTLLNLVHRRSLKNDQVGVIGLGSVGSELAFQIGQLNTVKQVHLYNRSTQKAVGLAMDMNQALSERDDNTFIAHQTPEEVFLAASVIFMAFRDQTTSTSSTNNERWQRFPGNANIVQSYSQIASQQHFDGTIFMLSNPVDYLTYLLYSRSQSYDHPLRTYQLYGSGLEVDVARAVYYARVNKMNIPLSLIKIFGNHSDTFRLQIPTNEAESEKITQLVHNASEEIRKLVPRTIFGPVAAAKRSFLAFQNSASTSLSTVLKDTFIGHSIEFRHGLPMVVNPIDNPIYQEILSQNRRYCDIKEND